MDELSFFDPEDIITVIVVPRAVRMEVERDLNQTCVWEGEGTQSGNTSTDFYRGTCPDPNCGMNNFFPSFYSSITCTACGKGYKTSALKDLQLTKEDAFRTLMRCLISACKPKKGSENIKVLGLCNYTCKLLSQFLSYYKMEKDGTVERLTENGKPTVFNCAKLGDKGFAIDPVHLNVEGYGRDLSGSEEYLQDVLNVIKEFNGFEERLVPVHADGDGHCLVHAISRALVGRELFWHPLRLNLYQNLKDNMSRYKDLLKCFVEDSEWETILKECLPDYIPPDNEPTGLRPVHILVLANVLKRPIILLDCVDQMMKVGDYAGVFLPSLCDVEECSGQDGQLHRPLCIAWSSNAHNHFIPLVGIKNKPDPVLPRHLLQATWGVDNVLLDKYIHFENGCCTIGGRMIQVSYIQKLAKAMEDKFFSQYSVNPQLVADVYQNIYKSKGIIGAPLGTVVAETQKLVRQRLLVTCVSCGTKSTPPIDPSRLKSGTNNSLYDTIVNELHKIEPNKDYEFRLLNLGFKFRYDPEIDQLVPNPWQVECPVCGRDNGLRHVNGDGSIQYLDGDACNEPGLEGKYFYQGKFYDGEPQIIHVVMPAQDGQGVIKDSVLFFQNQSNPELNTNAFDEAGKLMQKHYPGQFGKERLQSSIANYILERTAIKEDNPDQEEAKSKAKDHDSDWNPEESTKIILSGYQTQSVHKEELTKSETERQVKKAIEAHAPHQQTKKFESTPKATPKSKPAIDKTPKTPATQSTTPVRNAAATAATTTTAATTNSAAATATPSSTPSPSRKTIRIVQQGGGPPQTVTLTQDITIQELQQLVFDKTGTPIDRQKLRKGGLPPVMIDSSDPSQVAPLAHGDQIIVMKQAGPRPEAPAPREHEMNTQNRSLSQHPTAFKRSFDEHYPSDPIDYHQCGDEVDTMIDALKILAETSGLDLWHYVGSHPHLFSVQGMFFRQAQRDGQLTPGKHVTMAYFPGKMFACNETGDRLQLCIGEDVGHFDIGPDVDDRVEEALKELGLKSRGSTHSSNFRGLCSLANTAAGQGSPREGTTFGSSGAIQRGHGHKAFRGQGHTLSEDQDRRPFPASGGHTLRDQGHLRLAQDIRMPAEGISMTENIHSATQKILDLCDPSQSVHEECIMEEPEDPEEKDFAPTSPDPTAYTRVGPGFSVIRPDLSLSVVQENQALLERFNVLAQDQILAEEQGAGDTVVVADKEKTTTDDDDLPDAQQLDTMDMT